jgi:hypothetical protein
MGVIVPKSPGIAMIRNYVFFGIFIAGLMLLPGVLAADYCAFFGMNQTMFVPGVYNLSVDRCIYQGPAGWVYVNVSQHYGNINLANVSINLSFPAEALSTITLQKKNATGSWVVFSDITDSSFNWSNNSLFEWRVNYSVAPGWDGKFNVTINLTGNVSGQNLSLQFLLDPVISCNPPLSGSWIIENDSHVVCDGLVSVNGSVYVQDNSSLVFNNSVVAGSANVGTFRYEDDSEGVIENSTVHMPSNIIAQNNSDITLRGSWLNTTLYVANNASLFSSLSVLTNIILVPQQNINITDFHPGNRTAQYAADSGGFVVNFTYTNTSLSFGLGEYGTVNALVRNTDLYSVELVNTTNATFINSSASSVIMSASGGSQILDMSAGSNLSTIDITGVGGRSLVIANNSVIEWLSAHAGYRNITLTNVTIYHIVDLRSDENSSFRMVGGTVRSNISSGEGQAEFLGTTFLSSSTLLVDLSGSGVRMANTHSNGTIDLGVDSYLNLSNATIASLRLFSNVSSRVFFEGANTTVSEISFELRNSSVILTQVLFHPSTAFLFSNTTLNNSHFNVSLGNATINPTILLSNGSNGLNTTATILYYGQNLSSPVIMRNGAVCSSAVCTINSYVQNASQRYPLNVTVLFWSTYGAVNDNIPPVFIASLTETAIVMGNFSVGGNFTDAYNVTLGYSIFSRDVAGLTWANATLTSSPYNVTFEGKYLPVGNWTVNVSVQDDAGNRNVSHTNITSYPGISPIISGSSSQTVTLNTSQVVSFPFIIYTKGAPYVQMFINLSAGSTQFLQVFAKIGNSTLRKDTTASSTYSGAQSYALIAASGVPSYVRNSTGIYNGTVTLYLTMYSGLSAGTYTGNYGWGLSDS